jgi:hypothetical protein
VRKKVPANHQKVPLIWQAWGPVRFGTDNRFSISNSEVSMKAAALSFMLSLALLAPHTTAWARDAVLPAGTLVQCTLDEPNFSSATASVGDPLLCHPHGLQVFGQTLFPRGTYIVGHLADDKDPGHFWGKGYLKIEFDRIGLPSADLPLSAKIIAVNGYKVDRDGKIIGKGHAKRDIIEWLFPPLWPWKILTLPARGPRPTLKGEARVTLRLMDDVLVPESGQYQRFGQLDRGSSYARPALYLRPQKRLAPPSGLNDAVYRTISWQPQEAATGTQSEYHSPAADHAGWHSFKKPAAPAAAVAPVSPPPAAAEAMDADDDPAPAKAPATDSPAAVPVNNTAAPADNAANAEVPVKAKPVIEEKDIPPMNASGAPTSAAPANPASPANSAPTADAAALVRTLTTENTSASASATVQPPRPKLTLFAVRAGTVYAVTDYWRDDDRLAYVLSNGKEGQIDLSELDWKTTTQLNTERNVKVTLREGR